MSAATINDMIKMIPELASVDSGIVSFYLQDAKRRVILDGFAESNANFDLLQRYMCGHLMHENNVVRGEVSSESVADVSISYANTGGGGVSIMNKWQKEYILLKERLTDHLGHTRVV